MWKHEILNNFNTYDLVDRVIDSLGNILKNSIVFYCGDIDDIFKIIDYNPNETIFKNETSKLPYNNILFEFTDNLDKEKTAMLCLSEDDQIIINYFVKHNTLNEWDHYPMVTIMEIRNGQGYFEDFPLNKQLINRKDVMDNFTRMSKIYRCAVHNILLILNCKNIVKKENKPPEKLNKKRIKNGKLPLFSYYTLHIKDSINPSNSNNVLGDHNRIHLCRGHFKYYTEKNPLFGKLTGMYWWQPHVRGQNKDGIIMKDYVVKN
jgi:hypothetical protein